MQIILCELCGLERPRMPPGGKGERVVRESGGVLTRCGKMKRHLMRLY